MNNDHVLIKNDIKSISIHLLRILRWNEGYQSIAFLTLVIWTFFCYHTQLVLYTLPIWIALLFIYPVQLNETISTDLFKQELSLVLPSLDYLKEICQQWHQSWTTYTLYKKTARFVSFFSLWMLTFHTLGTRPLIWSVGTLILAWHSRGFQVIRMAYHRATIIAAHAKQKLKSISTKPTQYQELDRCYRFVVIEHQRWWFHKGWISVLLPHDRPKWSDEYLSQVPSIHEFKLPPATTKLDPNTNKVTEITWEWATSDWQINTHDLLDKDGWEYANWDWKNWSSVSAGPTKLTRRRHWFRHARLVVQEQQPELKPIMIPRSSSIMTSCSLSTSVSSFEEEEEDILCTTPTNLSLLSPPKKSTAASIEHHFWLSR